MAVVYRFAPTRTRGYSTRFASRLTPRRPRFPPEPIMPSRLAVLVTFCAVLTGGLRPPLASAQAFAVRIDDAIEARAKAAGVPLAPPADDAEFPRRAPLDFAGRIPTADAAKAFLTDKS